MPKLFHAFVNPVADQAGFTGTKPSDWNAALEYANAADSAPSGTDATIRELLDADRTYYVRTDGSDGNTGLVDSAGGAWLTLQHAWDVIIGDLDLGGSTITVDVGNGTYTAGISINGAHTGGGTVVFSGDTSTPANVVISTGATDCFVTSGQLGGIIQIVGFKLTTSAGGNLFNHGAVGTVQFGALDFGATSAYQIRVSGTGALAICVLNCNITGAATANLKIDAAAYCQVANITFTLTGTLNFGLSFANAQTLGLIEGTGATYTGGTITGQRFIASSNAVINCPGGGVNVFPGSVAGGTSTGGQYIS